MRIPPTLTTHLTHSVGLLRLADILFPFEALWREIFVRNNNIRPRHKLVDRKEKKETKVITDKWYNKWYKWTRHMLDLFQGCLYIDDYRVEKKFIRNEQKCLSVQVTFCIK